MVSPDPSNSPVPNVDHEAGDAEEREEEEEEEDLWEQHRALFKQEKWKEGLEVGLPDHMKDFFESRESLFVPLGSL